MSAPVHIDAASPKLAGARVVVVGAARSGLAVTRFLLSRQARVVLTDSRQAADLDPAVTELARAGYDPVFGARPLKRAIQQHVENPVARLILEGKFGPRDVVPVDWDGEKFVSERTLQ